MSPPPAAALALLLIWIVLLFGVTNVAGYTQWRVAADRWDLSLEKEESASREPVTDARTDE